MEKASARRELEIPVYVLSEMPRRKRASNSTFGERLQELRQQRGLTQTQLAEAMGSSQRAISHYETVADYPPGNVIVSLAKALRVTTDELLGLKKLKLPKDDPDTRKLWPKFKKLLALPEKDRRAVIRMINSLAAARR